MTVIDVWSCLLFNNKQLLTFFLSKKEVIFSNVIVDILFFVSLDVCSVSLVMKFLPVSEM